MNKVGNVGQKQLPFYVGFFEWMYNLSKEEKRPSKKLSLPFQAR